MTAARFADAAPVLLEQGYAPLPIVPASKRPALSRWTAVTMDAEAVEDWSRRFPDHGVGLRCGTLVGIDIDILDPDLAYEAECLVRRRLGDTPLLRVGLWPKRLLLYRTALPFAKLKLGKVEVLGEGQQFVAFGIHETTRHPYYWPSGETPLEVPLEDLPEIDRAACEACLAELRALMPEEMPAGRRQAGRRSPPGGSGPARDGRGRVTDGRDGWLSTIAFHAVQDASDEGGEDLDPETLAACVWDRFAATTDLDRPRKDGASPWCLADARRKVGDKLRLLAEDRLPARDPPEIEAEEAVPGRSVTAARAALDAALGDAAARILGWWAAAPEHPPPRIGIRASVGLGKTTGARRHLLALRRDLTALGAPGRILICTPSHALAEESAINWRQTGLRVAVLRGYKARHPVLRRPMCEDHGAVEAAIEAGMDVHETACDDGHGGRCAHFATCLKQANRREIAAAEIVLAPYDALWSGFAMETSSLCCLVIDEACWPRAITEERGLHAESLATDGLLAMPGRGPRSTCAMADLADLRHRAMVALLETGPGPLSRSALTEARLTAEDCRLAAALEQRALRDPGLRPGLPVEARKSAGRIAAANARIRARAALWDALADLAGGIEGRVRLLPPHPKTGLHEIVITGLRRLHPTLADRPVLHLDATLRPGIAGRLLPGLETQAIEAEAPHQHLTLVTGSFGKSALIEDTHATPEENRRRAARLRACADHVAWEARRVAPGRVLVITYQDCEAAFAGIPGVETGHFNAIAGLDCWRDVALLIVIGRPLPSDAALPPMVGAIFGQAATGGYHWARKGVRLRSGAVRGVRTLLHGHEAAETLRAAICDDELIQAIGRGRGVNRTAAAPLEVQVLGDVALPLPHDAITHWDLSQPDLLQRMLLAGIASDSPGDAAALHPEMFEGAHQAKLAFGRAGFKAQIPLGDPCREMSLKSAAYRRSGKGRAWQRAFWLEGDADAACGRLEAVLGELAGWRPEA